MREGPEQRMSLGANYHQTVRRHGDAVQSRDVRHIRIHDLSGPRRFRPRTQRNIPGALGRDKSEVNGPAVSGVKFALAEEKKADCRKGAL